MAKYTAKYESKTPRVRKKGLRYLWIVPTVLVVTLVVALSWGSVAKYAHQSQHDGVVKAKEFYFTSDYLTTDNKQPYTLNYYVEEVSFELRNYDGRNVSELDINYTVTCDGAQISTEDDGTIKIEEKKAVITLSGLQPGKSYTVTAVGQNGYSKTLQATFKVNPDPTGVYKNTTNYGDYVLLTIWTQGTSGEVSFIVPSGLIPDATDNALTGKAAGDTITCNLGANESRSYRFFTTDSYAGQKIDVTYNGNFLSEAPLN